MTEYLVIYEREGDSWGAFAPDLPGVGAAAESREEVESLIREAIAMHVDALAEAGEDIPTPSATAGYVKVA